MVFQARMATPIAVSKMPPQRSTWASQRARPETIGVGPAEDIELPGLSNLKCQRLYNIVTSQPCARNHGGASRCRIPHPIQNLHVSAKKDGEVSHCRRRGEGVLVERTASSSGPLKGADASLSGSLCHGPLFPGTVVRPQPLDHAQMPTSSSLRLGVRSARTGARTACVPGTIAPSPLRRKKNDPLQRAFRSCALKRPGKTSMLPLPSSGGL